jgi:hypothetical protein
VRAWSAKRQYVQSEVIVTSAAREHGALIELVLERTARRDGQDAPPIELDLSLDYSASGRFDRLSAAVGVGDLVRLRDVFVAAVNALPRLGVQTTTGGE